MCSSLPPGISGRFGHASNWMVNLDVPSGALLAIGSAEPSIIRISGRTGSRHLHNELACPPGQNKDKNMNRAFRCIIACVALVFLCSCSTTRTVVFENGKYPTGISADEGVVILLNYFMSQGKSTE